MQHRRQRQPQPQMRRAAVNNKMPELLSPAGDMEKMRFAIAYGADAVYLAGQRFGMRPLPQTLPMTSCAQALPMRMRTAT